jgi:hypothetical protein
MSTASHVPKFDTRGRIGIFLGFPRSQKGHLCYFVDTHRIGTSDKPVFDEECFPFASKELQDVFSDDSEDVEYVDDGSSTEDAPVMEDFDLEMVDQLRRCSSSVSDPLTSEPSGEPFWRDDAPESGDDLAPEDFQDDLGQDQQAHGRVARTRRPPQDFWIASNATSAISLAAVESVVKAKDVFEPTTYKEAMNSADKDEWRESITQEVNTLLANDTFEIIDRSQVPEGRRIVKSKWVFKVKRDSAGNFLSRKTRLVAKGFTEIPGVDYFEIFHPVGKGVTFRLLCAKAACKDLKLYHVDIKGAFLHASLQEEIYMELPPGAGFEGNGKSTIVKLKKSLYGLKQAGRDWFLLHVGILLRMGFKASKIDACLFVHPEREIWVVVYVDDDFIAVRHVEDYSWFVNELSKYVTVGSAGPAENYLGIRVQQQEGTVKLDQQAQVEELLRKFGMENANPTSTPAAQGSRLSKLPSEEEPTSEPYRSLVGALLYLCMHTRPDITYAVSELSKHCARPGSEHWVAAKRVLRYLHGTRNVGLEFKKEAGMELQSAADSDWAGGWNDSAADAKSTSGYVVAIAGSVISARSKRQSCTALSSCEAEYVSLALAAQEIVHCRQLLIDLGEMQEGPTVLKCDNMAAGELTRNETHQQRSKHIAIRYHFIRECVKRGEIKVEWCSGQDNVADMFTKPLGRILFKKHSGSLLGYV